MTFCMIYFFCAFIVIALANTLVPSGNWNGLNATRGLVRRKEKCWFQHQQMVVSRNGPSEKASNISVNIIWLSTNSSSSMWYLLWIAPAYLVLLSRLLIVCQGLCSQTSSYHEFASDERTLYWRWALIVLRLRQSRMIFSFPDSQQCLVCFLYLWSSLHLGCVKVNDCYLSGISSPYLDVC